VQLNFWINVRLASQQPEGSVTAIQYAFALMLMPQAAIAQSIATAALPTFSAQVARNELTQMRSSLSASLRGILLLSIPASIGLMLLNYPIVQLIYQRGEFTPYSTRLVGWALLWYAAGLVGHAMVEILARAFYALHDTRTPVLIGIAAMSLNAIFSYLFSAMFSRVGWLPHGGLALANSLATALEMIGLLVIMRKRLSGINGSAIRTALLAALGSGAAMAAAILVWKSASGALPNAILSLGGILIGMLVYGFGLWALKNRELEMLIQAVRSRLFKK
jgi:putative peptidoglycan lipid II flippase